MSLKGKVVFITGASRGIGKSIALRCAKEGAKITIAAKTAEPHPKLPGTIYTAAAEIEKLGGEALPVVCDIRYEELIQKAIDLTIEKFGGIDILVNNASAISLTNTEETSAKKYDLMHQVNARGTWLVSKLAIPHLKKSKNPHILMLSPPLFWDKKWFAPHVAYSMAKYGMSMCVLGLSEELKQYNIAVNALWPRTTIDTAAMAMIPGVQDSSKHRKPEIMADAAFVIISQDSNIFTGNFCVDEDVIRSQGIYDLDCYANVKGTKEFFPDFFLEDDYNHYLPPKKVLFKPTSKL